MTTTNHIERAPTDYDSAKRIAIVTCTKLQPHCVPGRINIAGSIRRRKSFVKDIEIVCLPQMLTHTDTDLFGGGTSYQYVNPGFVEAATALGKLLKGKTTGRYMQIELPEGINLDLFMPQPEDYYRQLAIRTGSAQYAHLVLANGWLKKGWCGVSGLGLRKISDCEGTKKPDGKTGWKVVNPNAELPPAWESEEDFFNWIGVRWIKPELRNL